LRAQLRLIDHVGTEEASDPGDEAELRGGDDSGRIQLVGVEM
jgi:hypothetical protein